MSNGLDQFNALSSEDAERTLYSTFASRGWAARVAAGRPYRDLGELHAAADLAWSVLAPSDWLDAFANHPRIGERGGHSPAASDREQSQVREAPAATLASLATENRLYEARFGHVFLISASGRSADEILEVLRQRMSNDPATELETATGEHRKITRLRMEHLLNP